MFRCVVCHHPRAVDLPTRPRWSAHAGLPSAGVIQTAPSGQALRLPWVLRLWTCVAVPAPRRASVLCPRPSQLASQLLNFISRIFRPSLRQNRCLGILVRSAHPQSPKAPPRHLGTGRREPTALQHHRPGDGANAPTVPTAAHPGSNPQSYHHSGVVGRLYGRPRFRQNQGRGEEPGEERNRGRPRPRQSRGRHRPQPSIRIRGLEK